MNTQTRIACTVVWLNLILVTGCAGSLPPWDSTPSAPAATPTAAIEPAPAATAPGAPALPVAYNRPGADDYRIGPQDLLALEVFGIEELSRKVRVNARGAMTLPLIGTVQAAGLTGEELEQRIAARLAETYLQDPQVSIFIEEYTSQRVTIEGAVNKPGIFPLKGETTLLQAIAVSEGLGNLADASAIRVFRSQPNGTKQALVFDLESIRTGEAIDPLLQGDDIVVVDTSTSKSVIFAVTNTLRGFIQPFGL